MYRLQYGDGLCIHVSSGFLQIPFQLVKFLCLELTSIKVQLHAQLHCLVIELFGDSLAMHGSSADFAGG